MSKTNTIKKTYLPEALNRNAIFDMRRDVRVLGAEASRLENLQRRYMVELDLDEMDCVAAECAALAKNIRQLIKASKAG